MNMDRKTLLILLLLLLSTTVLAKSYSLNKVFTDYTIQENGHIKVKETLDFSFEGQFSYVYRDFEVKNEKISNIEVFVNGKETDFKVTELENEINVNIPITARDEKKQIIILYELDYALKAYDDVAEFYWKVWPDEWEIPVPDLEGKISLPERVADPLEVYTYGHPKLEGKIGLSENQNIVFQSFNVPQKQWVEVRAVFPRKLLKSTEFVQVISGNGLQKIINEEATYIDPLGLQSLYENILIAILFLAPITFIAAWVKHGRDPKISYEAEYEREAPYNYSPAIVEGITTEATKTASAKSIPAVILDLCLKDFFKLEKIDVRDKKFLGIFGRDEDYQIIFQSKAKDSAEINKLTAQEKMIFDLINELRKEKKAVFFSGIEEKFKKSTSFAQQFVKEWQKQVEKEVKELKIYEKSKWIYFYGLTSILAFILFFVSIFLFKSNDLLMILSIIFLFESIALASIGFSVLTART